MATWWRHQMETFSALLAICGGNSPITGEFPAQRSVTQSFDVFFDLHPNQRLSKQSWGWWFETPSCPLWRHCNEFICRHNGDQVLAQLCVWERWLRASLILFILSSYLILYYIILSYWRRPIVRKLAVARLACISTPHSKRPERGSYSFRKKKMEHTYIVRMEYITLSMV